MRTDGRAEFPRPRERSESARLAPLLFSSRCHEEGGDRSDARDGRSVRLRSATIRATEEPPLPPRKYRYFLGGLRDQTCNLYIALYLPTYLPTRRAYSAKVYSLFYDTRGTREKKGEGTRKLQGDRAREAAATSFHYRARSLFFTRINCVLFILPFSLSSSFSSFLYRRERNEIRREPRKTIAYANYDRGSSACRTLCFLIHIFGGYRFRLPFGYLTAN